MASDLRARRFWYAIGGRYYPPELHNLFKDLPFLAERKRVNGVGKLICDYRIREKYSIHIRALQNALKHGCKLLKIHSAVKYKENLG